MMLKVLGQDLILTDDTRNEDLVDLVLFFPELDFLSY